MESNVSILIAVYMNGRSHLLAVHIWEYSISETEISLYLEILILSRHF